ncbi:RxLR effector protein [Phytophthora megakarya]|uniref:RxLR effector protein n=1 Tax=Phytophthora megakarya TaxID=4795 RepID=A0A225W8L9_9STRA|nr:RxLR effector protein [Phytophthora megakarya]
MQRDLQRAREDNAYLRTLLKQLNVEDADVPSPQQKTRKKKNSRAEQDADFSRALERRQARLDSVASTSGASAAGIELKSANDRVTLLEGQLLDAEETICHLKAEKLEALRDVERLNAAATERGRRRTNRREESEQRKLVLELEMRLAEQKQAHALEQEQRMAVIRDQEQELKTLRGQLEEKANRYTELQQRHMDLLEMDDQAAAMMKQRVTSGVSQFSIYGEESDEDDEAKVTKPQDDGGRARAPADADAVIPTWQEELVRHPTPHFDMQSPEVAYILRAWTKNIKKMRYLRRWLIQVVTTKGPLPDDFPMGVELPRLPPEVRDGFLTLVLPLLRKQTEREILAHSRRYNDGVHTDLRFRVVPRE